MGRSGGGGGQGRSNFDRILRRHIESATKGQFATVEQLVDHLRSTYPHYARHKIQPFTKRVDRIVQTSNSIHVTMDDSGDDSPSLKKRRKIDEREEKLQNIETQHMRKKSADVLNSSGGCSSSSLASPSSSADENTSTSEDAIYEEKFEPEFDLMKSMLRENLRRKSKELVKSGSAKEVVELDVVNSNDLKKVNLMDIEGQSNDGLRKISNNDNGGGVSDKIKGPLFKDLGGMAGVLDELLIKVIVPLYHPQVPRHLGVRPVGGILLHGPPGCGKTTLARAIANETRVPFYEISAAALVSGVSGASEENIRELFSKAYRTAPSIVFIDEIDAIASKRENLQREMERRIVTQLMTCMDASQPVEDNAASEGSDVTSGCVLVIGATNRPDALDPALRRPGRFDREIYLGVPDEVARIEILTAVTRNLKVEGSFDLVKIARSTPGWVGADLTELTNEAGKLAIKRIIGMRKTELSKELMDSNEWWRQPWPHEDLEKLFITMADFEEAAKMVQSSTRREGFSAIPNVKWDDVGGFNELKQEFDRYIVRRIKFSKYYEHFGVDLETGFLLYGPPGCGKTLIAKAVANEAGANFIHIKGPELLNKYVGESELAIRTIFSRARTCSPCILFFDEVDALTTKRGKEGGWVVERLLNQLLIELDGSEERRGVYVIGATNRPQSMDPAVLRPGRFGKLMYVPLPNEEERGMILKALARDKPVDTNVDLMILAKDICCQKFSGADLAFVMKEASAAALEEVLASSDGSPEGVQWAIKEEHLKRAIEKTSPSVEDKQIRYFNRLSKRFKAS